MSDQVSRPDAGVARRDLPATRVSAGADAPALADSLATPFSEPASERLLSVDLLRGLTVAFMILVNDNGSNELAYSALKHSAWNGFTPTDLVFPNFLFIMGISMVLSRSARKAQSTPAGAQLVSILRRTALLIFFGLVVNAFPYFDPGTLRLYGVLQRIAVCYLVCALLQMISHRIATRAILFAALLLGYWVLLRFVPVPGFGVPTHGFPLLDHDINLTAWLDRQLLPHRLFEGTRDPEGLLSDLPAIATTLLGMLAGSLLKSARPAPAKLRILLVAGAASVAAGLLWSQSFPINKKLWTSSYVLCAGGLSLLLLGGFFFLVEMRRQRGPWTYPLLVFGTNAISVYVFAELLATSVTTFHVRGSLPLQDVVYRGFFRQIVSPAFGSLLYSLAFVSVCFLVALPLYRRRIFLKL